MQKFKFLITSSERIKVIAEKLRDQLLEAGHLVSELWKDSIKNKSVETTIEILEGAAEKYDFAVIVLDATDVDVNMQGDPLKDRDNCLFEAGLFIGAIGRERCFIINSFERPYLPGDLSGIEALHFREPEPDKIRDGMACSDAIRGVGSQILDMVGKARKTKNIPLSKDILLAREQKKPEGDLEEGYIVVNVTQPIETGYVMARQVRNNMNAGIDYIYCFHGDLTGVPRICQFLQMLLLAPMLHDEKDAEYSRRREMLLDVNTQDRIIRELEGICSSQHLKIYLLKDPPEMQYIIHNANSDSDAIRYVMHKDKFIEWERGEAAHKIWSDLRKRYESSKDLSNAVFCGASGFNVKEDVFYGNLMKEIKKSFPKIHEMVAKLCCDGL